MVATLMTSLLAFLLLVLSARIIALRGNKTLSFFAFNNLGELTLNRSIRAQGNLAEYAPIFLILLFIAEYNGSHPHILYFTSSTFLIARLMHGLCFGFMKHNSFLRVTSIFLTFISILILTIYNVINIM